MLFILKSSLTATGIGGWPYGKYVPWYTLANPPCPRIFDTSICKLSDIYLMKMDILAEFFVWFLIF